MRLEGAYKPRFVGAQPSTPIIMVAVFPVKRGLPAEGEESPFAPPRPSHWVVKN